MSYILDRWEGDWAILTDGETRREIRRACLAEGVREGDVLFCDTTGIWQKDEVETTERKARIAEKMKALWG